MQDNAEINEKKGCLKEALSKRSKESAAGSSNSNASEAAALKDVGDVIRDINMGMVRSHPTKALLQRDHYKLGKYSIRRIDLAGLLILPCLFILFNLWYWINYTFFV